MVEADEGFRVADPQNETCAVFCRLEHVVPWGIQGALWESHPAPPPDDSAQTIGSCARCGQELGENLIVIVRHRGVHRIADGFCDLDHLLEWAKAGGRYGVAGA